MKYYAVLGTLPFDLNDSNVIYTGNTLFQIEKGSVIETVLQLTRNGLFSRKELVSIAGGIIKAASSEITGEDLISYLIQSGIYKSFPGISKRFSWLNFSNKARFALPFIKGYFEEKAEDSPKMYRSWLEPEKYFSRLEQSMLNYLIFQQRETLKGALGDSFEDKLLASYPEILTEYDFSSDSDIFRIPKYKGVPASAINAGICNLYMQRCLVVMDGFTDKPDTVILSEKAF